MIQKREQKCLSFSLLPLVVFSTGTRALGRGLRSPRGGARKGVVRNGQTKLSTHVVVVAAVGGLFRVSFLLLSRACVRTFRPMQPPLAWFLVNLFESFFLLLYCLFYFPFDFLSSSTAASFVVHNCQYSDVHNFLVLVVNTGRSHDAALHLRWPASGQAKATSSPRC